MMIFGQAAFRQDRQNDFPYIVQWPNQVARGKPLTVRIAFVPVPHGGRRTPYP